MDTKDFDPEKFMKAFKKETGLTNIPSPSDIKAPSFLEEAIRNDDRNKQSRYQDVVGAHFFAIAIGDESKLTKFLNYAKALVKKCPQEKKHEEILREIFNHINSMPSLLKSEKYRKAIYKSLRVKEEKALKKQEQVYEKKILKAIETLKDLDPDPSKLDEAYLLELAKERAPKPSQTLYQLRQMSEYGMFARLPYKRKNPKGNESVRLFIYGIHDLLRKHKSGLTDNAICTSLASLLNILTDNRYTRQNIFNVLSRKPEYSKESISAK